MKWLRNAAIVLAGILVAVGFGMLGRSARQAKKAESRTETLLSEGTEAALKKAEKETAKAAAFREDAQAAAAAGQAAIDRVGTQNEDMAAILADWRTDRVR